MKINYTLILMAFVLAFMTNCNTSPKNNPQAGTEKIAEGGDDCIDESLKGEYPCTKENRPVCGCDGNTYANPCLAKKAGVSKTTDGPCSSGSNKATSYIIQLDPSAFPELEKFAKENPGSDRPTSGGESEAEKFAKKLIIKFAKEKLDIKASQITQYYSGILFGFAATIPANKIESFVTKLDTLKEISSYEIDGVMNINKN